MRLTLCCMTCANYAPEIGGAANEWLWNCKRREELPEDQPDSCLDQLTDCPLWERS